MNKRLLLLLFSRVGSLFELSFQKGGESWSPDRLFQRFPSLDLLGGELRSSFGRVRWFLRYEFSHSRSTDSLDGVPSSIDADGRRLDWILSDLSLSFQLRLFCYALGDLMIYLCFDSLCHDFFTQSWTPTRFGGLGNFHDRCASHWSSGPTKH